MRNHVLNSDHVGNITLPEIFHFTDGELQSFISDYFINKVMDEETVMDKLMFSCYTEEALNWMFDTKDSFDLKCNISRQF